MTSPRFLGAELLGDSMLLRFSLRHADTIPKFKGYPRSWGMCRSGKTAKEMLVEQWTENNGPYRERAIIMIGTNDLLRHCPNAEGLAKPKKALRHTIKKIKDKATRKFKHVYWCTVPEVPRLEEDQQLTVRDRYNSMLTTVNADIIGFGERHKCITSINLKGMFSRDCYERYMGGPNSRRQDDIHLNFKGQDILRRILLQKLRTQ